MTDYFLEITLQSPLTSSAGEGRVGWVDRDIAFDDLGLPILPGRRLKGLWREAYQDVVDAWKQCDEELIPIPAEDIFGKAGEKPDDSKSGIHLGNAELHEPKASSLKEWLKYLQQPGVQSNLHPDDVVQHFADVRSQTAMDRETGSALENTFRLTRTLKAGWVFWAPVHFVVPPDDALLAALVLGAAALQYMGTARTRGLGKVRCRFICGLTEKVLHSDTLPSIDNASTSQLPQTSETEDVGVVNEVEDVRHIREQTQSSENQTTDAHCSCCSTFSHLLRYRLTLKEPVVIPVVDGDPNTIVTRQDIPGSHIWGVAAWHYLRQPNHKPADDAFRRIFLDGHLRFLTAYPEAIDPEQNQELTRTIPIPHSIRKFKEDANSLEEEKLVDLVESPSTEEEKKKPKKRLERRYGMILQGDLKTRFVKTERNYHHARAGDRRKGRALENDGNLFRYEAIQANQPFQGAVLGSKDNLVKLKEWLSGEYPIKIGRSRSAQYGETEFEWIDEIPKALSDVFAEWNAFVDREDYEPEDEPPVLSDDRLILTTLSPLLAVNDNGHPDARFPLRELAKMLGIKACELKLSCSYTRTELISGYHSHLRLPHHQWQAIAAGSVFVFCVKSSFDTKRLLKLEHNGLGLRKNEGFGRLAVNRQDTLELQKETQLNDPKCDVPNGQIPHEIENILKGVVLRCCLAEIQSLAMRAASTIIDQARENRRLPSNALLGRFRLFLQWENLKESSPELLKLGKEKLPNHQIDMLNHGIPGLQNRLTLFDLFKHIWTERETITRQLANNHVKDFVESRYSDTQETIVKKLVEAKSDEMYKVFFNHLLTALHRAS
ncbi:MAG: RAMP superfamily CRISPR-associated protein [Candidatus Poribacteria bacterium]|nr:RAMP superfamily CRISPR-associated protein [Candidatus Poribacteria bacterium]